MLPADNGVSVNLLLGVIVTALTRRLRNVALLSLVGLFGGVPAAQAAEQRPAAFETFAGISCLPGGAFPTISYKGWGVDYAHGSTIDVYLDVTGPSTRTVEPLAMTTLTTDGNGAWSTSTYSDPTAGAGSYSLHVSAYSTISHALLGDAYSSCTY